MNFVILSVCLMAAAIGAWFTVKTGHKVGGIAVQNASITGMNFVVGSDNV